MTRRRLPSDPSDLLREVELSPVPEEAFERVALRFEQTLAHAGSAITGQAGAESISAPPGRLWAWLSSPPLAVPLVFLSGALAGAAGFGAVYGKLRPVAALVPASALISAAPKLDLPPVEPPRALEPAPVRSSSPAAPNPATSLAGERSLLDRARARMAASEPREALELLTLHVRRYPRGLLTEEREAMAINALVNLGRQEEAQLRGKTFHERFPASLVRRSVEAALANTSPRKSE